MPPTGVSGMKYRYMERSVAITNSGKVEMTSNNRNLGELTMADDSMTFWDVLGQQPTLLAKTNDRTG